MKRTGARVRLVKKKLKKGKSVHTLHREYVKALKKKDFKTLIAIENARMKAEGK